MSKAGTRSRAMWHGGARFHALGVRWMLLTYNRHNELGGGCLDVENEGLTDFGRAVLDEMCRVGMVPCCSHVSERAALECSSAPPCR